MILIVGKAGAGKTAQAEAIKQQLGYPIISVSGLIRRGVNENLLRSQQMGIPMSDEVTIPLVEAALAEIDHGQEFILEGFVRSIGQAQWVASWATSHPDVAVYVFHLHIPHELAMERLLKRGRDDDKPEVIARRLKVMYEDIIDEVVRALKIDPVRYFDIDGTQPRGVVTSQIVSSL